MFNQRKQLGQKLPENFLAKKRLGTCENSTQKFPRTRLGRAVVDPGEQKFPETTTGGQVVCGG
jgi:hypothetical protein